MKNKIKFSIIIPVYNIEKYIKKCIDSIINQSYKNYEVIIVNDGSTDNSSKILNNYKNKTNIKIINQKNMGLSEARNNGVKKSCGDYIIFVDGDDYLDKDLLKELNNTINDEDIIRYQIRTVDENYNVIEENNEVGFKNLSGIDAFEKIVNYKYVEPAWCYLYKREYYLNNNFKFKKGTYHEDFGLIPLVLIKATSVTSINYIGYNYVQRNNSIMNSNDYSKEIKKSKDILDHYKYIKKETKNINSITFNSFIANSVIKKSIYLKGKEYKDYLKELKKYNVYNDLLTNTIGRKIKKVLLKISPKIYYKIFGG